MLVFNHPSRLLDIHTTPIISYSILPASCAASSLSSPVAPKLSKVGATPNAKAPTLAPWRPALRHATKESFTAPQASFSHCTHHNGNLSRLSRPRGPSIVFTEARLLPPSTMPTMASSAAPIAIAVILGISSSYVVPLMNDKVKFLVDT